MLDLLLCVVVDSDPREKKLDKLEDQIQREDSGSLNFRESDPRHRSKTNHPRNVIKGALLPIKARQPHPINVKVRTRLYCDSPPRPKRMVPQASTEYEGFLMSASKFRREQGERKFCRRDVHRMHLLPPLGHFAIVKLRCAVACIHPQVLPTKVSAIAVCDGLT